MEHLVQLNDGPLDGVELVIDHEVARRIRSLSVDVVSKNDMHDMEEAEVKSATYDLYVDEPSAADDGSTLCFYHDRSTMLPKHPLAKIRHYLPDQDRRYWNDWLSDITEALDACYQHVSPDTRRADRAIKAYEKAQRRIAEMPKLSGCS